MKKVLLIFVISLFLFVNLSNAQGNSSNSKKEEPAKKANKRPVKKKKKPEPFDETDVKTMATKCVKFETESGNIELEMFPESAPETVRNFLNLTAIGAFNSTTFSRVVPDFVIQGGDLYTNKKITNAMAWRAQETIPDEPNLIKHKSGIISMARGEEANSASTHFFILLTEASTLDGKFAAFGRVINGMETVTVINKMPVDGEKPKKPVIIKMATVFDCEVKEETKEETPENEENKETKQINF